MALLFSEQKSNKSGKFICLSFGKVGNERRMQKAEYRYYEISQDLPVMALSGKKWEYLFVDVEEILKEVL